MNEKIEKIKVDILQNIDLIAKNLHYNNDVMLKKSSKDSIKILSYKVENITQK